MAALSALLCAGANLPAQEAGARYRDLDPAASYLGRPPGKRAQFKAVIEAALRKNPKNAVALTHRAYLFNDMGDAQRAVRDFDAALAASEPGSVQARHVHWSRGWARYDTGDVTGALADWNESARLHGGKPYWLPYTSALGYWTLGDAESALRWFGIAAASRPEWVTDEGVREKTRYWSKQQQAGMWGLYQAWKAGPARSSPPLQP